MHLNTESEILYIVLIIISFLVICKLIDIFSPCRSNEGYSISSLLSSVGIKSDNEKKIENSLNKQIKKLNT